MGIIERLLQELNTDGSVTDVRVGSLWTAVCIETALGLRAGLASTQLVHDLEHGRPPVSDAGRLVGRPASELAHLALSDSLTERSIGFATLNALIPLTSPAGSERNAETIIIEQLRERRQRRAPARAAIVGHFPFVERVRDAADICWVLELCPRGDDLPAARAPEVLPQADVVAITGMSLVNGTFESLAALCRPDAYVVVMGPSTPLSPILFEYGMKAVSGTIVVDIPEVLAAVSQGANFRQVRGRRLVTMERRT